MKLSLLTALAATVCLAESSWVDPVKHAAKAKTVAGDVSILRDTQLWALAAGEIVKVKETVVTGADGRALFELADGSSFEMFPNSKLVFRKNAGNWRDLLDLYIGKIRVHIEHLGKPNPHNLRTPTAVISVRGTTFEITVDEDETSVIYVEEGLVEVRHALLPTGTTRELGAGEALRVYRDEPIARASNKGEIFKQVLRMGLDAIVIAGRPGAGGGGTIGGPPGGNGPVGDSGPSGPPPATGPGAPPPIE